MPPTALITGGAGFIGSHLAQRLKDAGRRLILVDDLSTGRRGNVEHLFDDRCRFVHARAGDALRDDRLLQGVNEIHHLAATVGVKLVVDDPAAMIRNNIDQTAVVLDAAARCGAAVLIASSSEVYGKCPTLPLREDQDLAYGPTSASRWSYGLTKALNEHLALDYARTRGLKTVIVRLFNTIGPRQLGSYGMVVPRFVARAVANQPLEVYGDGTQTRTFCDVRDVTDAMVRLLAERDCHGQVFNIGSDQPITIGALADRVVALAGGTAGVRRVDYRTVYGDGFEDTPHRLPDLTRVRQAINFNPRHRLDDTLRELIRDRRLQAAGDSGPPRVAATGSAADSTGETASDASGPSAARRQRAASD